MSAKISVVLPLLLPNQQCIEMTRFCLSLLYLNATKPYELVIVETGSEEFMGYPGMPTQNLSVKYVHFSEKTNYVHDWNAGADAATGDFLVHIGNDVFVGDQWDAALMEPFEKYPDCGVSCTSAVEPGAPTIGHHRPLPGVIAEAVFTPFMMFRKQWRFDPVYEGGYSDNDLIMQMYSKGLRSYRSFSSVATHLRMVTFRAMGGDQGAGQILKGEDIFYERWRGSPLYAYSMLRAGRVEYGREHFARCSSTPDQEPMNERLQRLAQ